MLIEEALLCVVDDGYLGDVVMAERIDVKWLWFVKMFWCEAPISVP
jgi:hypothetical protein